MTSSCARAHEAEFAGLLADVRAGGDRAFARLVVLVQERVRKWAIRMTDDADAAEDVVQLVLIRLQQAAALPRGQRLVFELVDIQGIEPGEVARQLSLKPVTVRTQLFKARRSIRTGMLDQHGPLMREFLTSTAGASMPSRATSM